MKFLEHWLVEGGMITLIAFLLYIFWGHKIFFLDEVQDLIPDYISADIDRSKSSDKVRDVVCVSVDDSLKRGDILIALRRILASGPAVVGIDIKFEEPEYTRTDTLLENLIRENKSRIVLSNNRDKDGRDLYSYFVKNYEDYPYLGYAHAVEIKDKVRILKLEDGKRSSFVALLSKLYNGKELNEADNHRLIINYKHGHTPIKSDLLSRRGVRNILRGKVVILGIENQREDLHYIPGGIEDGYMIQFHALKSLLEYEFDFCHRYCLPVILIFLSVSVLMLVKYFSRKCFLVNSLMDFIMFVAMVFLYELYKSPFNMVDYTTAALWNTVPVISFLALGGYSFIVVLLGKSEKLDTKLVAKCAFGEKRFPTPVVKLFAKGFHWIFNKAGKSFLLYGKT